jgi:chaperonin GroES
VAAATVRKCDARRACLTTAALAETVDGRHDRVDDATDIDVDDRVARRGALHVNRVRTNAGVRNYQVKIVVAIQPLEDRIFIQQLAAEQVTTSGIVIHDSAKEKPQEGEVVAIGPGRIDDNGNRVPIDVAVGDVVLYSKYGGTEVKYDGVEYLVLSARDVLAIVKR